MTAIKGVIFADAEQWLKDNLRDLGVDSVSAINLDGIAPNFSISLYDEEEDQVKTFTLEQQVAGLQKLADEIGHKRLFVGGISNPADLEDACNWDVEVTDAFFQLIYHGEVIYG